MLQKLCDCCKKEMSIDSVNLYDEGTFYLNIGIEKGTELTFNGDLCERCEKEIVEDIIQVLNNYNIKPEKEETPEIEEEDDDENFEMKLIEDKQNEENG